MLTDGVQILVELVVTGAVGTTGTEEVLVQPPWHEVTVMVEVVNVVTVLPP
jgi:hypothetical protein